MNHIKMINSLLIQCNTIIINEMHAAIDSILCNTCEMLHYLLFLLQFFIGILDIFPFWLWCAYSLFLLQFLFYYSIQLLFYAKRWCSASVLIYERYKENMKSRCELYGIVVQWVPLLFTTKEYFILQSVEFCWTGSFQFNLSNMFDVGIG